MKSKNRRIESNRKVAIYLCWNNQFTRLILAEGQTKKLEVMTIESKILAKQICQYNGQKGTDKQIEKTLKGFKNSYELMLQFKQGRF